MFRQILQTLIITACMSFPSLAMGGILTADDARKVGADFFRSGDVSRLADVDALTLAYVKKTGAEPTYYVFNANDGQGFIIVSADDSRLPVIAYSTNSTWQANNVPELASKLLNSVEIPKKANVRRTSPLRANSQQKLLKTPTWSQEAPFNNKIPNRRLVGCVGTALAEIIKYHRYPASRPVSLVNAGEPTAYNWDNMLDGNYRGSYTAAQGDAVATLVADAAISIGTDFGMSSSSAFEVKVPGALVDLFGYDAGVSYKKGSEMDRSSWDAIIVNEIDADRPVLYSGQDVSAGHAFVCDGYDMRGTTPYFHINWGWGGAADGYYASDALNPTVSTSHSFNNLTTIVYNIKPATNSTIWSPIHITSDERQVGLTVDVTDFQPGATVSVRAGALKNISNTNFSGKISLALFNPDGSFKHLLGEGRNLGIISLQIVKYADFTCIIPADAVIGDDDIIRLVTKDNTSDQWLPVASDLMTIGEIRARGNAIPYFNINFPEAVEGVTVGDNEPRVIKGRDYTFTVFPAASDKVVTVKANGFILTPNSGNNYRIDNVTADQEISILVQDAADVVSKRTLWVQAGKLSQIISDTEAGTIKDLTLFGTIDVNDFTFMRERMKLERIDISGVNIVANGANPANAIPAKAFTKCGALKQIILPKNVNTFKSGCFSYSGLESIEIPAAVATYEYNIFLGCSRLREVTARRSSAAWVNWCVFNGTPKARLVVPVGASSSYKNKEYWQDFKEIVEENAVAPTHYSVLIQDVPGVKFTSLTDSTMVLPGTQYQFKAELEDLHGDATAEFYANNSRLTPDQTGVYTVTVNTNTLIHVNFKQPQETGNTSPWRITGAAGGVGLITDVVNVVPGKSFTIRANALAIPSDNAAMFYCAALTTKDGAIKELISPVINNNSGNFGNLPANFTCQIKEASVREGNLIRIVSSYNNTKWSIVHADNDSITDSIAAIGNRVIYHSITMPEKVEGASIQGAATRIVRGMPFSLKVIPVSTADRITIAVNGINKVVDAAVANLTIPAVTEDLDITIQVNAAGAGAYTVVNVREGELASKITACPSRLKIIGVMRIEDFDALRSHAGTIVDLDLADVTIKGASDFDNAIPANAFASPTVTVRTALKTIILPTNLYKIDENAFYRCMNLAEITIPASVSYVGAGAFSSCAGLRKIIVQGNQPPATGYMTPFPTNTSRITLEVPKGAEDYYASANYWSDLNQATSTVYYNIQIDPERTFNYNEYYTLTKIEHPASGTTQVTLGLPNFTPTSYKKNPTYRPGVAFKFYDNSKDATYTSSYLKYGQHTVKFDSSVSDPQYSTCPQNHLIEIVFHYSITFVKPEGITAEFHGLTAEDEWKNVDMSLFVPDSKTRPTLYREGRDYKFRLADGNANTELKVVATSNVMTKPGENPVCETRVETLVPDENGIYTLTDLQGDTEITVTSSLVIENGSTINSAETSLVDKNNADKITDISLSGEIEESVFEEFREKFEKLETLDLSEITNEVIPDNAFSNMSNLKSVVIPDNVISVGSGAFAGCENLESVTLPGVDAIGADAFKDCSSLTSITLLGKTAESSEPSQARRRAPKAVGLTEESFSGVSPNCLIYLPEGVELASNTLNIIVNTNAGTREAKNDIKLNGAYPFNAPASFSLGEKSISLTVDIPGSINDVNDGWKGIVLPFDADLASVGYDKEFAPRGEVLSLLSFTGKDSETMTSQTAVKANTPYLASINAPFENVAVTFSATGKSTTDNFVYDINSTPGAEEICAPGKDYTLYGGFNGVKNGGETIYTLDEKGVAFNRAEIDDEPEVGPFSVYACANNAEAAASFEVGTHPLWVFEPTSGTANEIYRSTGIELSSKTANAEIFYTLGDDTGEVKYDAPLKIAEGADKLTLKAVAKYKGFSSDPVTLEYELKKSNLDYPLEEGWNWISHNIENDLALEKMMSEDVDRVLSQTQEVIRDPKFGLVGSLSTLRPLETYKVNCNGTATDTRTLSGVALDPATPLSLTRGWNWIGVPVEGKVSDLLADFSAEDGDMIVSQDGFTQADYAEGKWIGDLLTLEPGKGYLFYSTGDKEFTFNTVPSADAADRKTVIRRNSNAAWTVDTRKYPSVMPVTSRIAKAGGIMADRGEFEIAAFCGDECRGVGVAVDDWIMISVYGNAGDEISFRLHSTVNHSESLLGQKLEFSEIPVGSLGDPYMFDSAATSSISSVTDGSTKISVDNGTVTVDGDARLIEVYDVAGTRVAESAAKGGVQLRTQRLAAGVYIVVVYTTDGKRLLVEKIEVK